MTKKTESRSGAGLASGKGEARGAGSSICAGAGLASGKGRARGTGGAAYEGAALEAAQRGSRMKGGDTAAAERGKADKGARTKAQVISDVKKILALDSKNELRTRAGTINVSAVARKYLAIPALKAPVRFKRITEIVSEAIESGDLAISTSKMPK